MNVNKTNNSADLETQKQKKFPKTLVISLVYAKEPAWLEKLANKRLGQIDKSQCQYQHWFNVRSLDDETFHSSNRDEIETTPWAHCTSFFPSQSWTKINNLS